MILGTSTCTWYFFVYMYLVFLHSLVQKNQTGLLFMYCKILHVPVLGFSTYTWYLYICLVMQHTFWTSTYIWYFICICTSMCIWELYMYFYTSSWFKYFYLSLMWGLTSQYWHKHSIIKVYMFIIYMLTYFQMIFQNYLLSGYSYLIFRQCWKCFGETEEWSKLKL